MFHRSAVLIFLFFILTSCAERRDPPFTPTQPKVSEKLTVEQKLARALQPYEHALVTDINHWQYRFIVRDVETVEKLAFSRTQVLRMGEVADTQLDFIEQYPTFCAFEELAEGRVENARLPTQDEALKPISISEELGSLNYKLVVVFENSSVGLGCLKERTPITVKDLQEALGKVVQLTVSP